MLKKTMTYTDFDGVERTEDFYFHLSKAELFEMELSTSGGLSTRINKIIAAKDLPTLITIFKDLVLKAYGEKSADGKRFIKNAELSEAFSQTEAYSELFLELATNEKSAEEFIKGIIPSNLK